MKKIDKIKEYFLKNNIVAMNGCYVNFPDGHKARYTYTFWTNLSDFNSFSVEFIVCLKKENKSYLVTFLDKKPRYQKIGDFNKGVALADEIDIYFSSDKYTNFPDQFTSPTKQIHSESGRANIEKYKEFWKQKMIEYPEYAEQIQKYRLG